MQFLIIFGFIIFLGVHCVGLVPSLRNKLSKKYGEKLFKTLFSMTAAVGMALLLVGVFKPGLYVKEMNLLFYNLRTPLMLTANILIIAGNIPNNHIRQFFRHPMLLGILIWSFSHFMLNQHMNHLIMFTSFSVFSLIMFIGILIREKNTHIKNKPSFKLTLLVLILGNVAHFTLAYGHKYFVGIKVI